MLLKMRFIKRFIKELNLDLLSSPSFLSFFLGISPRSRRTVLPTRCRSHWHSGKYWLSTKSKALRPPSFFLHKMYSTRQAVSKHVYPQIWYTWCRDKWFDFVQQFKSVTQSFSTKALHRTVRVGLTMAVFVSAHEWRNWSFFFYCFLRSDISFHFHDEIGYLFHFFLRSGIIFHLFLRPDINLFFLRSVCSFQFYVVFFHNPCLRVYVASIHVDLSSRFFKSSFEFCRHRTDDFRTDSPALTN